MLNRPSCSHAYPPSMEDILEQRVGRFDELVFALWPLVLDR